MEPTRTKRPIMLIVIAILLAIGGLNAFVQAALTYAGVWTDTSMLPHIQLAIAFIAFLGAYGAWQRLAWSRWAALAYGVVTGAMIVSLPRFTEIPDAAVAGLRASAAITVCIGAVLAWGIHVAIRGPKSS
jgi:hypothetical protein